MKPSIGQVSAIPWKAAGKNACALKAKTMGGTELNLILKGM
jgi:hypothetical protein